MLCLRMVSTASVRVPSQPASTWLRPGELRRWQRFSTEERRAVFLAGRWLLRGLLAEQLGQSECRHGFEIDDLGRTQVLGAPALNANLSHSGGWIAAVLADHPVGVDVESIRPDRDFVALADAVHSPSQCDTIAATMGLGRARQFYTWWTLKEAWLKCRGKGLDLPTMRRMDFRAAPQGASAVAFLAGAPLILALDGLPPCGQLPTLEEAADAGRWVRYELLSPDQSLK